MQRSVSDILAGLIFVGFGLAFAVGATTYEIGTPLRMGPGFYPLVIGGALVGLGGLIALKPSAPEAANVLTAPKWRAVVLVIGAVAVFGLTVRGLGLVPAVFLTALIATLASRQFGPLKSLAFAIGLTVLSVLIFVVALSLRLPLLGPWIPRL